MAVVAVVFSRLPVKLKDEQIRREIRTGQAGALHNWRETTLFGSTAKNSYYYNTTESAVHCAHSVERRGNVCWFGMRCVCYVPCCYSCSTAQRAVWKGKDERNYCSTSGLANRRSLQPWLNCAHNADTLIVHPNVRNYADILSKRARQCAAQLCTYVGMRTCIVCASWSLRS